MKLFIYRRLQAFWQLPPAINGDLAQMVERRVEASNVIGSIPIVATKERSCA